MHVLIKYWFFPKTTLVEHNEDINNEAGFEPDNAKLMAVHPVTAKYLL